MSILSPLLCLLGRHEPLRRNVSWDGLTYIGQCRHCDRDIERASRRNWRARKAKRPTNPA